METTEALKEIVSRHKEQKGSLIGLLQDLTEQFGYLPEEMLREVSRELEVPLSRFYSLATFYTTFRLDPIGKHHVCVCVGTACHVRGAPRILEEIEKNLGITDGETTEDMEYSLETVACIGACGLSPCIMINSKVNAKMTPKKVAKLFARGSIYPGIMGQPARLVFQKHRYLHNPVQYHPSGCPVGAFADSRLLAHLTIIYYTLDFTLTAGNGPWLHKLYLEG